MTVVTQPDELRAAARAWLRGGRSIGFVPTLGNLHEGHLSLMRRSVAECDETIVSIFVNPLQFGAGEDFEHYPRTLEADLAACRSVGVGTVFAPALDDFYPPGYATRVTVLGLTDGLCGRGRPGHFEGVTTVVARLLGLILPTRAYFGEKDYQQLVVIQRMSADLGLGCEIVPMPIVREADGLALSSRNQYLSPTERAAALCLSQALAAGVEAAAAGETDAGAIRIAARQRLMAEPLAEIEYVDLVDAATLAELERLDRPARLCLAVRIGPARLIDNVAVEPLRAPAGGGS